MRKATAIPLLVLLLSAAPVRAADLDPRALIDQAREAMAAGDFAKASAAYGKAAAAVPQSPELAYDRGVAAYRQGDYTKAAGFFTGALATRDRSLEAKAKFNLGNCAYATALARKEDPKAALEQLKLATAHYRDAIEANPQDKDARANIELAHRLIRQLEEQQQRQQQQNPQDQQDKKDQENKPQSQPSSQPQSQPASQPPEQKQEGQKSGQQQDQSGQKEKKKGAENEQPGQRGQEEQAQEQKADRQQGKLETAREGQPEGDRKDQQQAQMIPTTQMSLTKEEAEKLLQLIRDKERQRAMFLQQLRRQQGKQAPVDKDW